MSFNLETWSAVMTHEKDDKRHGHGDVANNLTKDEVTTILATYDFFGADDTVLQQIRFDLLGPRYRVFDWLAMMVQGRCDHATGWEIGTQVMVYAFLDAGGDVDGFIENLRVNDYDVDEGWQTVIL